MAKYEKYWLKIWHDRRIFESDPIKGKKKIFVTFPYPYMQGPLHIGHCFTSTRCDIYARFKRMQGFNVLFPWAWHWTGESIPGQSYRLQQGDKAVRRAFVEIDHVPEKEVEKFADPEYLASYYTRVSRGAVKETGFSVDWRREFTTVDPAYKKFIEWQYLTLRELGYVVQGTHPVVWCSRDESPTGDHDRLEGSGVSPEEFNLLKFRLGDEWVVAGTLRPETIFGATNVWVNPEGMYSEVEIDGADDGGEEKWIVSSSAMRRLSEQQHRVKELRSFRGSQLIGKVVEAPLTGAPLPILPASFVDTEVASGVVYSVPAHAPYDYVGLRDIQTGRLTVSSEVRAIADKIRPISIITVRGYSELPAEDAVNKLSIKDATDPALEEATAQVYKAEFHTGLMKANCDGFAGKKVDEAKPLVIDAMKRDNRLTTMFELPERVTCKCGTRCYVKILENQWFLNYSDEKWKGVTKELIASANVFPPESLEWYYRTIDWLKNWPCARKSGMGTKLPWDKEWIVETLSDSTVYMIFYTIGTYINSGRVKPEQLSREIFDYIVYGRGSLAHLSKTSGIEMKLLSSMRNEFNYWYPVDLRNSAKELIPNHLTFFAFHHAALFVEKERWPRGFSVNGMIQLEGKQMSKSKGIFVTWRDALEKYGADATRATLTLAAGGMDDANWQAKNAEDMKDKIESIFPFIERSMGDSERRKPDRLDDWLFAVMNTRINEVTAALEEMKVRRALAVALLDVWNDVRWYLRRSGKKLRPRQQTLRAVFEAWIRLLCPFIPFAAEELNKKVLGNKGLISTAEWPSPNDFRVDSTAVVSEQLLTKVIEDARNLLKIVKMKDRQKSTLNIYAPSDEAHEFFVEMVKSGTDKARRGETIRRFSDLGIRPDRVIKLEYELGSDLSQKIAESTDLDEYEVLADASEFLSREIGIEIRVAKAGQKDIRDPANKAKDALPFKPAFLIE